jgi:hypothetical protein
MPDHDPALADVIHQIANILAAAYLRLRFPEPAPLLDSPQLESDSCEEGLTP